MSNRETKSAPLNLHQLLNPKSIVVVGASTKSGNFGTQTVKNLNKFGFPGDLYVVNRREEIVEGIQSVGSIEELPLVPDLAILSVPVSALLETIKECTRKGIKAGVAYASGLRESGEDGALLQQEISDYCTETGFALAGPNCLGVVNFSANIAATFATQLHTLRSLGTGNISIVSQSGGIATNMMQLIHDRGFGLNLLISSGNEAIVSTSDFVLDLSLDTRTKVILIYLEGIDDGKKLLESFTKAKSAGKHVILLKAGTTSTSAIAAKAHTGALSGEDKVFDQLVKKTGVIRVHSIQEMVDTAVLLSGHFGEFETSGKGIAFATIGGGNGVMAVDRASQRGLDVPALSTEDIEALTPLLVSVATVANPLDLTPASFLQPEAFANLNRVFSTLSHVKDIDALLLIIGSMGAYADKICSLLEDFLATANIPISIAWPPPPPGVIERMAVSGVPVYPDVSRAVDSIAAALLTGEAQNDGNHSTVETNEYLFSDPERLLTKPGVLTEDQVSSLLKEIGFPVAESIFVSDPKLVVRSGTGLGFPVALKLISENITHRDTSGFVRLGINDEGSLAQAVEEFVTKLSSTDEKEYGFLIQKMYGGKVELIVSAFVDEVFGPCISVGTGGVLTELINDVNIAISPVSVDTALELLESASVFNKFNVEKYSKVLRELAEKVSIFSKATSKLPLKKYALELNPIKVSEKEAVAIDGLLVIESV